MDRFVVRLAAIALNLYILAATLLSLHGVDTGPADCLFACSALPGLLLAVLCHTQGRYHCTWARALCYNLIIVPLLNFIDCCHPLFLETECYIYAVLSITLFNTAISVLMAVRHFRRAALVNDA